MLERLSVVVHPAVELQKGVFKTAITHPKLEGELFFVHGNNNRESYLRTLDGTLAEQILGVIELVGELTNEKDRGQKP